MREDPCLCGNSFRCGSLLRHIVMSLCLWSIPLTLLSLCNARSQEQVIQRKQTSLKPGAILSKGEHWTISIIYSVVAAWGSYVELDLEHRQSDSEVERRSEGDNKHYEVFLKPVTKGATVLCFFRHFDMSTVSLGVIWDEGNSCSENERSATLAPLVNSPLEAKLLQ